MYRLMNKKKNPLCSTMNGVFFQMWLNCNKALRRNSTKTLWTFILLLVTLIWNLLHLSTFDIVYRGRTGCSEKFHSSLALLLGVMMLTVHFRSSFHGITWPERTFFIVKRPDYYMIWNKIKDNKHKSICPTSLLVQLESKRSSTVY